VIINIIPVFLVNKPIFFLNSYSGIFGVFIVLVHTAGDEAVEAGRDFSIGTHDSAFILTLGALYGSIHT
jgi:hypothetical protein